MNYAKLLLKRVPLNKKRKPRSVDALGYRRRQPYRKKTPPPPCQTDITQINRQAKSWPVAAVSIRHTGNFLRIFDMGVGLIQV